MAALGLDVLPIEVLWEICHYLDLVNLLDLSLVCHQLRHAVYPLLFRKVKVTMRGKQDLQRSLDSFPAAQLQHVRHLSIEGWIPTVSEEANDIDETCLWIKMRDTSNLHEAHFETPRHRRRLWESLGHRIKPQTEDVTAAEDDAWKPLAAFVRRLPHLGDVSYSSTHQLAPCVLAALHARPAGSCRLHLNTFWLRTLRGGANPRLSDHETALITSPCLHSLATHYREFYAHVASSFYREAFSDLIAFVAPRLEELYVFHFPLPNADSRSAEGARWTPKPEWVGFQLPDNEVQNVVQAGKQTTKPRRKGSLRIMSVDVCTLATYLKATELSKLTTLNLISALDVMTLEHLANECLFPALLQLSIDVYLPIYHRNASVNTNRSFGIFFTRLPVLERLQFKGGLSPVRFKSILDSVGKTLRVLIVEETSFDATQPLFDSEGNGPFEQSVKACPDLEYVHWKPADPAQAESYWVKNGRQFNTSILLKFPQELDDDINENTD